MAKKQHLKLMEIAQRLRSNAATNDDRCYLADCLQRISHGGDANEVLGIKRSRGQGPAKEDRHFRIFFALTWIAAATRPKTDQDDSGLAMRLEDALGHAAEHFNVGYETLRSYWGRREYKHLTGAAFNSMAELYPD